MSQLASIGEDVLQYGAADWVDIVQSKLVSTIGRADKKQRIFGGCAWRK
jgi:hypothetical protein